MPSAVVEPHLRAARASVFGIFGVNGFVFAVWVVHIPAITERTGVSKALFGLLILLLAAGAIVGMRAAGPLADRYGSRTVVAVTGTLISLSLVGPGIAETAAQLGLALFVLGIGNGALDVSMNAQAVHVERGYGRPIMAAFHAFFSCGGVVGALLGALFLHLGWSILTSLAVAATLGVVILAASVTRLLPHVAVESETQPSSGAHLSRRAYALGGVAFAVLLCEGVANDWSALQVKEHLGAGDATAALAFGAFSATMTLGRFGADRVAGALGPVAVLRYGTLIAAVGMAVVIASTWIPLTLLGWALFGIGLSGAVPQIFTAAGNLSAQATGANLSRVVSLGYLAFIAGPSVIGGLTKVISLTTAMVVPLAAVLIAAAAAPLVAPAKGPSTLR